MQNYLTWTRQLLGKDNSHLLVLLLGNLLTLSYLACHTSPLNSISHSFWRFQGQSHPVDEAISPSVVHMRFLGLSFIPARVDPGRQSRWPWPVSQACTLLHYVARAAATGPGSLCQLVPDLFDSQTHPHVCHGGHQRWHEVLIMPLARHPSEGVSDSNIFCHAPVAAALLSPRCLVCHLGTSAWGQTLIDLMIDTLALCGCVSGLVEAYAMIYYSVLWQGLCCGKWKQSSKLTNKVGIFLAHNRAVRMIDPWWGHQTFLYAERTLLQ